MLTANYLMNVAEPMVDLWAQVEDDIIADISRRLAKNAGTMTETAKWQALKAREMGILQTDIASTVSRITGQSQKETYGLIVQACQKALAYDDAIYMKHGLSPIPLAQSAALQDVIMAGCRKTNGLMRNFTRTLADTASKAFENAMDRAWLQVNTGAFSYTEALNRAIRDLSAQGIQKIAYPSGHVDRMDVAARRALITGLNQTTAELQLARMDELQTDLIEVSSHAGARPTHAIWQGQVYQKTGRGKYENFYDETGYGTGDGLCGWNCYHSFFPYFEGMSHQAFERDPSARLGKSNDQMYEESQRQRALERRIRDSRRACAASSSARDAATDPQAKAALEAQFEKDAALLKEREQALDDFCAQTGRTKLVDRVYVPTYNRSVSSKTTWAARRANANKPAASPTSAPKAPKPAPAPASTPTSGFKKITGDHTIEQDRAAVNPNYALGREWQINCQRCCPTYEMRRRGFDVQALPFKEDKRLYCHAPDGTLQNNIFKGATWENIGATRTDKVFSNVLGKLKEWGPGARGEVYVQWKRGSAHVFMAENDGGSLKIFCPQSNRTYNLRDFERIKPSKTLICRLDNCEPTDLIKECCK